MTEKSTLAALIDHAIGVSSGPEAELINEQLSGLNEKIRIIEGQIEDQPDEAPEEKPAEVSLPGEVQYQINSLEFEKSELEGALDTAAAALANTNAALNRETKRRVLMEEQLSDLESRLMAAMGM